MDITSAHLFGSIFVGFGIATILKRKITLSWTESDGGPETTYSGVTATIIGSILLWLGYELFTSAAAHKYVILSI